MAFKNLGKRTVTGILLAVAFVLVLFLPRFVSWGGGVLLSVCALAVLTAGGEIFRILFSHETPTRAFLRAACWFCAPLVTFVFCFLTFVLQQERFSDFGAAIVPVSIWIGFILLLALHFVRTSGEVSELLRPLAEDLLAFTVLSVCGSCLIGLSYWGGESLALLWLVASVASNDMAAYFGGSVLGGPKLAEAVSPGKTVAGGIVGGLAGILCGFALGFFIFPEISSFQIAVLSALVALSAPVGDLVKSVLKRVYGVKDTGTLFPGHGGVLDRIDGMLFGAVPTFLFLVSFFGVDV